VNEPFEESQDFLLQKAVISCIIFLQEDSCVTLVDGCWLGMGSTGVFLFQK
jgi:hypothetical protein